MAFRSISLLALGIALLCAGHASAQVSLGVKVGTNLSTLSAIGGRDDYRTVPPKVGLVAGLTATVPIRAGVLFQPELLVSQKGATFTRGGSEASLTLTYLELPLLFQARVGEKDRALGGFLNAGISGAFLVTGKAVTDGSGNRRHSLDHAFGNDLGRFDLCLVFGGGMTIDVGPGRLLLEPRASFSMLDIDRNASYLARNWTLGLHVGYLCNFGPRTGRQRD